MPVAHHVGVRVPDLPRCVVLRRGTHRHADGRAGGAAVAVGDRVREHDGAAGTLGEADLESLAVVDDRDRAVGAVHVTDLGDDDRVTVGVVVVEQDREARGASGTRAQVVVDRHRRLLVLLDLRVVVGHLFLLLVVVPLDQVGPVVDELAAAGDRPRPARGGVVRDDRVPVVHDRQRSVPRHTVELLHGTAVTRVDGLSAAPRGVGAGPGDVRPSGATGHGQRGRGHRPRGGHAHGSGRARDDHRVAGGSGALECRRRPHAVPEVDGAAVDREPAVGSVEDCHVGPDARHLEVVGPVHAHRPLLRDRQRRPELDQGRRARAGRVDGDVVVRGVEHGVGAECQVGLGRRVELVEAVGRRRPELAGVLVADDRGAAGEEDLRGPGRQGDGVTHGRVRHVDLGDGALGLVDAVDHRAALEHREGVRRCLDRGVELQDLGVRASHGSVLRRRHPDGPVAEVDALGVVAARHDGGTRDQGRDDHRRPDRHGGGPVPRDQPPDHEPLPMVAQRCALAAPVLPSRLTATEMHSSSPAAPDTTKVVPDC